MKIFIPMLLVAVVCGFSGYNIGYSESDNEKEFCIDRLDSLSRELDGYKNEEHKRAEVHKLAYMQGVNACIVNATFGRSFDCKDLVLTHQYKEDSVFVLNAYK